MYLAHRYISSLLLAAALAAPVAVIAAPQPQVGVQVRVYDRHHKDYHNWDDREEQSYHRYLAERHRTYRVYVKQNRKEQDHYWSWRHAHQDHD